jgi:hypothetical protein
MEWPWLIRVSSWRPSRREQLVAAMTVAAGIVFLGLLLDVPSVKRVKILETERRALEGEISTLQNELNQFSGQGAAATSADSHGDPVREDMRLSALLSDLAALADRNGVEFIAVRPIAVTGRTGALEVELNAPFRVLGAYLNVLEQSPWSLTIANLHLGQSSEHATLVSARFTVTSPTVLLGLAITPSESQDGQ